MSTDLVACQKCGEQLSPYVVTCPRCGHCRRNSRKRFRLRLFGDSSNTAGHVLENVYPRQNQQLPPPAEKPSKAPVTKQSEPAPNVPSTVSPVAKSPQVSEPDREVEPKAESVHATPPPVYSVPTVQPPVVGSFPPAEIPTESKQVTGETSSLAHESDEPTTADAGQKSFSSALSETEASSKEIASAEELPSDSGPDLASPNTSANQVSTTPDLLAPDPIVPSTISTTEEAHADENILATPKQLIDVALNPDNLEQAVSSMDETLSTNLAELTVGVVSPAEPVGENLDAEVPPRAPELENDLEDASEEPSASKSQGDDPEQPEYEDEDFEAPAKTNNARVGLVVVLMIAAAIAIKVAFSFF